MWTFGKPIRPLQHARPRVLLVKSEQNIALRCQVGQNCCKKITNERPPEGKRQKLFRAFLGDNLKALLKALLVIKTGSGFLRTSIE